MGLHVCTLALQTTGVRQVVVVHAGKPSALTVLDEQVKGTGEPLTLIAAEDVDAAIRAGEMTQQMRRLVGRSIVEYKKLEISDGL